MAGVHFKVTGDANGYVAATRQAEAATSSLTRKVESEGKSLDTIFKKIAGAAGTIFSLQQVDGFRQKLIDVRGEFQNLEIAFSTMLQSEEKSVALMAQLTETAAKTPFGLKDISNGAKQLLAYGTAAEEVNDTIIRLGNIASGLTIPLNDLVYLYGTTMTQGRLFTQDLRQFQGRGIPLADELAKQFDVTKDKVGELVTAGKIGFPEVQKAIESLTNEGGKFYQLMEKQSSSLEGMRSNLQDSIDMMINEIGTEMQGALGASINVTAKLVENYRAIGQAVMDIAVAYGAYKAALLATMAIRSASTKLSYSVEIDELAKLIPLKNADKNADIEAAVASGKLTQATAEKVIAMREEAAEYVKQLELIAAKKREELTAALVAKRERKEEIDQIKEKIGQLREEGKTKEADALSSKLQSLAIGESSLASQAESAQIAYNTAVTNANTAAQNLNSVSNVANAKTTNILALAKAKLATAFKTLGDAIKANPVMVYAAAIAAAVTVVYKLATAADRSEAALSAFNDILKDIKESGNKFKEDTEDLIRTVQDETKTSTERMDAYKKLASVFPGLTKEYSFAALSALELSEAQKLINQQIEETNTQKLKETLSYWQQVANGGFFKRMGAAAKNMGFWSFITEWDYRGFAEEMAGNITNELNNQLDSKAKAEFESKTLEAKLQIRVEQQSAAQSDLEQARQDLLDWVSENQMILSGMELPVGPEFDAAMAGKTEDEIRAEQDRIIAEWNNGSYGMLPFQLLFNYQQSQEQFDEAKNYVEQLTAEQKAGAAGKNYGKAYKEAETAWKNAKKALEDIKNNRDKYTQADYDKAVQNEKDTSDTFKSLGGDITQKAANDAKKKADALKKAKADELKVKAANEKEAARQAEDLANMAAQAEIDAEKDAAAKKRKQRELDNKIELQQLERQKQDYIDALVQREKDAFDAAEAVKKANNEDYEVKAFDESASRKKHEADAEKVYASIRSNTEKKQSQDAAKADADRLNELLEQYGTYEEKRNAIHAKYQKLREGTSGKETQIYLEQESEALYELEQEYKKVASSIQNLFGDMSTKSASELNAIADEGEKALNFIKGGQWSENAFGISKEAFEQIKKSPEELDKIAKAILGIREQADALENPLKKISEGFKELFDSSEGTEKFEKSFAKIQSGVGEVTDAIGFVSDSLRSMGEAFGSEGLQKAADGIDSALNVVGETMSGAQAGAAFGPWGAAIGAALGLATSLATEISKAKDAAHQVEIDRLAGENENLEKSYDELGRSVEKAFSVDASNLIDQQNDLLAQKKANLELMIAEEQAKKNVDSEQVTEWENEIKSIENSIEDNAEKAKEAILGISFDGFRDNFLDALLDMENGAKGFADTVKEDIRKAMYEALLTDDTLEQQMQSLYDNLADAIEADDAREIARLQSAILNLYDKQEEKAREIDEKLGYEPASTRSATEKTGVQATQSSVDEMTGRLTALQYHAFSINERVGNVVNLASQILARVINIEGHTSRLENIESFIQNMQSHISDIVTKGVKLKK